MSFHPRTTSGAWLDAKTPASSAMTGPRGGIGAGRAHLAEELRVGHAAHDEIEAQQIRVDPRREERHVVLLHRRAHLGLQGIAVQDFPAVGAVFGAERGRALQVEEELAQPVVSHGSILPRARVSGTKRTASIRRRAVVPSECLSMTSSCCASPLPPTGITSRPPGLSCSRSGGGTSGAAAVTMIESKGACSAQAS